MKLIEGHDGAEVEVWQVEVVLQQVQEAVTALPPLTVLQGEAHAAQDGEATAAVEQDVAQVEVPLHIARLEASHCKRKKAFVHIINPTTLSEHA